MMSKCWEGKQLTSAFKPEQKKLFPFPRKPFVLFCLHLQAIDPRNKFEMAIFNNTKRYASEMHLVLNIIMLRTISYAKSGAGASFHYSELGLQRPKSAVILH